MSPFRSGSAGLRQANTVDNAGVVQFVGNNGILVIQNRLEQTAIGVKTGAVEDGILQSPEIR